MSNYRYYKQDNKIIAVSTYAGKTIRGIAKCNPEDKFDEEKGKEIAAARCNAKIAVKRLNNACSKYFEAYEELKRAEKRFKDMCNYLRDANNAKKEAECTLESIMMEV